MPRNRVYEGELARAEHDLDGFTELLARDGRLDCIRSRRVQIAGKQAPQGNLVRRRVADESRLAFRPPAATKVALPPPREDVRSDWRQPPTSVATKMRRSLGGREAKRLERSAGSRSTKPSMPVASRLSGIDVIVVLSETRSISVNMLIATTPPALGPTTNLAGSKWGITSLTLLESTTSGSPAMAFWR